MTFQILNKYLKKKKKLIEQDIKMCVLTFFNLLLGILMVKMFFIIAFEYFCGRLSQAA